MSDCRCARCTRKEIYNATGMTLSLAWNKVLGGTCHAGKQADDAAVGGRSRPGGGTPSTVKQAS